MSLLISSSKKTFLTFSDFYSLILNGTTTTRNKKLSSITGASNSNSLMSRIKLKKKSFADRFEKKINIAFEFSVLKKIFERMGKKSEKKF